MLQARSPDPFEDARPCPGLKTQVTRAARAVLTRDHLPLATGAQDIQDAVENGTVRHPWAAVGPRGFVGRQDGFDQVPQVIRNLAESIPLLCFGTHRKVLRDVTMLVSALTNLEREGF